MNNPLISVIVPIYKVEDYIKECVDSIIDQTYKNLEIILVDDGSPDKCPDICDEYASKDTRIKVIHKPNGGLSDARNAGLDVCKGEYVAFVDSDDFIDKEMYEEMVRTSIMHNADIVRCDFRMYGGSKYQKHSLYHKHQSITILQGFEPLKALLSCNTHCAAWDKLYKRDFINNTRFINGRLNEDIIFQFLLLKDGGTYVEINNVYYNYRIRKGSITNGSKKLFDDLIKNSSEMSQHVEINQIPVIPEMEAYEYSSYIQFCRCQFLNRKDTDVSISYGEKKQWLKKRFWRVLTNKKLLWRFKVWYFIIVLC